MNSPSQSSLYSIGGSSAALWWSVHFSGNAQHLKGAHTQQQSPCKETGTAGED